MKATRDLVATGWLVLAGLVYSALGALAFIYTWRRW